MADMAAAGSVEAERAAAEKAAEKRRWRKRRPTNSPSAPAGSGRCAFPGGEAGVRGGRRRSFLATFCVCQRLACGVLRQFLQTSLFALVRTQLVVNEESMQFRQPRVCAGVSSASPVCVVYAACAESVQIQCGGVQPVVHTVTCRIPAGCMWSQGRPAPDSLGGGGRCRKS